MDLLPFKPFAPGVRTLWVLRFKELPSEGLSEIPCVEFFIPSPFGQNEWYNYNPENTRKAQEMLNQINRSCQVIREECASSQDFLDKSEQVAQDLLTLDQLLQNFNEEIDKIYPPSQKPEDTLDEEKDASS